MALAELERRLQIAELGAAVEAPAGQPHRERALFLEQRRDRVGELDLAARAGRDLPEELEDARREHVAADDAEVRRRGRRLRLLDDAVDARHVALQLIDGD